MSITTTLRALTTTNFTNYTNLLRTANHFIRFNLKIGGREKCAIRITVRSKKLVKLVKFFTHCLFSAEFRRAWLGTW